MDHCRVHSAMARATLAAFGVESPPPKECEDQSLDIPTAIPSIETLPKEATGIASRACDGCRKAKRRCDKILPKCSACAKRNTTCEYNNAATTQKHKRTGPGGSNHADVESSPTPTPTPSPDITPVELEPITALVGPELTEDRIARIPYWMYMNSLRVLEQELGKTQVKERVDSPMAGYQDLGEKAVPVEAVHHVFEHYELLDRILSKVDLKTAQRARRVNKTFHHVVKRSSILRRAQIAASAVNDENDDDTWSMENHTG